MSSIRLKPHLALLDRRVDFANAKLPLVVISSKNIK